MRLYLRALKKILKVSDLNVNYFNVFLFDSFEGLPVYTDGKNKNPAWSKSQFLGSVDRIKGIIQNELPAMLQNTQFIKGFYENTLTRDLRISLEKYPPSIVNIDVDYFTSTHMILEWIYSICQEGSIFYFDDIFEYLGNQFKGEGKAIADFNKNHFSEGYHIFPFSNFGIPSYTGKVFTLNKFDTPVSE